MKKRMMLSVVIALVICAPALAGKSLTVEELQATIENLTGRLAKLESRPIVGTGAEGISRQELLKIIKEMNADASTHITPKWMEGLKFYGDLRLRYQGQVFSENNAANAKNRHRARFRIRVGMKKSMLDKQMEVGFRLASGSNNDPTSTNQTFDGHFSKKQVWIDLAYAKYKPRQVKGLEIIGGKMKKPMVHTDLVWDSDVNPEGFWGQYKRKLKNFEPFVNAGYFIMDEQSGNNAVNSHDTIMMMYQAGFHRKFGKGLKWTSAVAYYDLDHFDTSYRAANGNNVDDNGNLAARKFQMINVTNKLGFKAFGLPMAAYFDFIHNCGDADPTADFQNEDNGCAVGLKVGKNKKKGDWSFGYKYAYIEANSTPGALNDSDFGGSNRQGHVLGAKYNLADSITLGGKFLYTQPITGATEEDRRDATVQVDMVWKF